MMPIFADFMLLSLSIAAMKSYFTGKLAVEQNYRAVRNRVYTDKVRLRGLRVFHTLIKHSPKIQINYFIEKRSKPQLEGKFERYYHDTCII